MKFELPKSFVDEYRAQPVAFGFGDMGKVTFLRTYSRQDNPNVDGAEGWADVCERVINGMYEIQRRHCQENGINWNHDKALRSAKEAYHLMFNFKWSPPGRGLWAMGTDFVMERGVPEALQNCGFVSTRSIVKEGGSLFAWLMEMSMLGVGVGFDTRGAGTVRIERKPDYVAIAPYIIPDTREGWAVSVSYLIDSYIMRDVPHPRFDYSQIRPKGSAIVGFGGVASGPGPLIELHRSIRKILDAQDGQLLSSRTIVDLCNLVGRCVVSGNVRRSAEIALGDPTDSEFINLKNYELHPDRMEYGWVSNNSVFAEVGMDYTDAAQRTWANGEPGYYWLGNARQYGRMNGAEMPDNAIGGNPCLEQPLNHKEMCTLDEMYLPRIDNRAEFAKAIKYAYLYAKTVTLLNGQIGDADSREIMEENRRIGSSVTGIAQFYTLHGSGRLRDWLDFGYQMSAYYDQLYSQWLGVNESIRRTSVKPSGTVSIVAGVTPGVHFAPAGRHHIRRIVLADDSPLVEPLQAAGYPVEESAYTPGSVAVSFPIDAGPGVRSEAEVGMTEQLDLIALVQRHWADNAVSATVKFDRKSVDANGIKRALEHYQHRLKGISFLPSEGHGYEQAPYESITEAQYADMMRGITPFRDDGIGANDKQMDLYCDGEACVIAQ